MYDINTNPFSQSVVNFSGNFLKTESIYRDLSASGLRGLRDFI